MYVSLGGYNFVAKMAYASKKQFGLEITDVTQSELHRKFFSCFHSNQDNGGSTVG